MVIELKTKTTHEPGRERKGCLYYGRVVLCRQWSDQITLIVPDLPILEPILEP
jgi:hypothetical protein